MSRGYKPRRPRVPDLIADSGVSIYEPLPEDDPRFISNGDLERILRDHLKGLSLKFPIRTRAKVAKTEVCK